MTPGLADMNLLEVFQGYREDYQKLRDRQELHEEYYWQTFKTNLEGVEGGKEYFRTKIKSAAGMRLIENPVNHIAMDSLRVEVEPQLRPPHGLETNKSNTEANFVERWLQAIVDDWMNYWPNFFRDLVKQSVFRGEGWLKLMVDGEAIENPKDYRGNPYSPEVPDSKFIYASPETDKRGFPLELFEEKIVTLRTLRLIVDNWHGRPVDIMV